MNKKVVSIESILFNGQERNYEVVDKNLNVPCPKYFISHNNGKPFISNEVPEKYRGYMVFHELYEFETRDPLTKDSCVISLKKELETVPENIKEDYIEFRKQVFEDLVTFLKKYDKSILDKVSLSLDYLENL
tara:strand:- start:278 stop:673 length:396 start_codon:yes stop_codon:yes gene_type:complete